MLIASLHLTLLIRSANNHNLKVVQNIKCSPYLIQRHLKKTRVGMKVLDFGTKWSWVVSSMLRPFYSRQGSSPVSIEWEGCWASGAVCTLCSTEHFLLTYYNGHSPSCEASQFSASQEIPLIFWNPNVRYHVYNSS